MPRIALFHPAFVVPGGAEYLCLAEALYLRSVGEDVGIVTFGYDPEAWQGPLAGLPVRVAAKRHWSDLFFGLTRMGKLRVRGQRAEALFQDCEVVVAHNHPCNAMLGASTFRGRKVWQCNEPHRRLHLRETNPVLTAHVERTGGKAEDFASHLWGELLRVHDLEMQSGQAKAAWCRFDIEQSSHLDHVFAISAFSRDNARRIYGRCGEEVVYPMVSFPDGGRTRSGLDRSGLQILVQGRQAVLKNIDTVIRGFCRFKASHPGSHLHLVGDGPARSRLEKLAQTLLPDGGITFHGFLPQDRLKTISETCDVMASLTLDEPFGLVYPEGAARGLLLIGPNHGGPAEILESGRFGWCVDAFSPAALEEALCEIWSLSDAQVDSRRLLTDQACRARFSPEVIGPQLQRVILQGSD